MKLTMGAHFHVGTPVSRLLVGIVAAVLLFPSQTAAQYFFEGVRIPNGYFAACRPKGGCLQVESGSIGATVSLGPPTGIGTDAQLFRYQDGFLRSKLNEEACVGPTSSALDDDDKPLALGPCIGKHMRWLKGHIITPAFQGFINLANFDYCMEEIPNEGSVMKLRKCANGSHKDDPSRLPQILTPVGPHSALLATERDEYEQWETVRIAYDIGMDPQGQPILEPTFVPGRRWYVDVIPTSGDNITTVEPTYTMPTCGYIPCNGGTTHGILDFGPSTSYASYAGRETDFVPFVAGGVWTALVRGNSEPLVNFTVIPATPTISPGPTTTFAPTRAPPAPIPVAPAVIRRGNDDDDFNVGKLVGFLIMCAVLLCLVYGCKTGGLVMCCKDCCGGDDGCCNCKGLPESVERALGEARHRADLAAAHDRANGR